MPGITCEYVSSEGDPDACVTEPLADDLRVHALAQQHRGVGVPHVVDLTFETRLLENAAAGNAGAPAGCRRRAGALCSWHAPRSLDSLASIRAHCRASPPAWGETLDPDELAEARILSGLRSFAKAGSDR